MVSRNGDGLGSKPPLWHHCHSLSSATDSYKDPSGRGNVRRLLVIAAIPIFLTNGISIKEAREHVCVGLQGAIGSGEFIRLAKTLRKKACGR